jgi:hypothetical protein
VFRHRQKAGFNSHPLVCAVVSQVVGHVKTCLIIIGGYVFFIDMSNVQTVQVLKNVLGVSVSDQTFLTPEPACACVCLCHSSW